MHGFVVSMLKQMYLSNPESKDATPYILSKSIVFDMSYLLKRYSKLIHITDLCKEVIGHEITRSQRKIELKNTTQKDFEHNERILNDNLNILKKINKTREKIDCEWYSLLQERAFLPIVCDEYESYKENIKLEQRESPLINKHEYYIPDLNKTEYEYIKYAVETARNTTEALKNLSQLFIGDNFNEKNIAILYFEERHEKFILSISEDCNTDILKKLKSDAEYYEEDQHWLITSEWLKTNIELLTENFKIFFNSKKNICFCFREVFLNEEFVDYETPPQRSEYKNQISDWNECKLSHTKPLKAPIKKSKDWIQIALKDKAFMASKKSIEIWDYSKERQSSSQKELGIFNFNKLRDESIEIYNTYSLIKFKQLGKSDYEFAIVETESNTVIGHSSFNDYYYMQVLIILLTNGLKTIGFKECFNYISDQSVLTMGDQNG